MMMMMTMSLVPISKMITFVQRVENFLFVAGLGDFGQFEGHAITDDVYEFETLNL